ncbi:MULTISPECIES: extracellular solute-binding protein [unclassified Martelella]|uniref:ABC transporter substrate-binding protein n=1 Tax=unclassified Martelella TaxID=2629616 RepID=UPI0025C39795|nr:extracellular solute-binding protein [Martelella sp.]
MNMRMTIAATLLAASTIGAKAQTVPEGYPADYARTIEASRDELGLLVYSNFPASFWEPLIEAFDEAYPWIKVETANFDAEMWEKYRLEAKQEVRTADIITTVAPEHWVQFVKDGHLEPYASPELPNLPAWSVPFEGLYTISAVPMPIVWNRALVNPGPQSLAELAEMVKADPDRWRNKITMYDAEVNPYGLAIMRNWLNHKDNDWSLFETIGPMTLPERGAGTMREKTSTGEYLSIVFTSGLGISQLEAPGGKATLDYAFPKDGTPLSLQSIGITKTASSPNSAKLLLDFILSRPGQIAFAKAGFTPYREDISPDEVPFYTLPMIRDIVGEENLFIMSYTPEALAGTNELIERWVKTFRQK